MEGGGGWQVSGGRRGPRHSRTLQAPQRLLVLSGRETGAGIDCACVQGKQQRRLQEGLQVRGFNEEPPTLRSRGAGGGRERPHPLGSQYPAAVVAGPMLGGGGAACGSPGRGPHHLEGRHRQPLSREGFRPEAHLDGGPQIRGPQEGGRVAPPSTPLPDGALVRQ